MEMSFGWRFKDNLLSSAELQAVSLVAERKCKNVMALRAIRAETAGDVSPRLDHAAAKACSCAEHERR